MSRPKDFLNWSPERQEKWREKARAIGKRCYLKNGAKIRRKVRIYKAKIRGTVLAEDGFAKKRVRRPEIRMCIGDACSNTMEYTVWVARNKLCKSCAAKKLQEEKQREHRLRRFYKFIAERELYGKLDLREVYRNSNECLWAADFHVVEVLATPSRGYLWVKAYIRNTDKHRCGRPTLGQSRGEIAEAWSDWKWSAYRKEQEGKEAYALGEILRRRKKALNVKKQRRAAARAELLKKRLADLEKRRKELLIQVRRARLRLAKKKEKKRKETLEAVRVNSLRQKSLSAEVPFFQMMAGAAAIAEFVEKIDKKP